MLVTVIWRTVSREVIDQFFFKVLYIFLIYLTSAKNGWEQDDGDARRRAATGCID